MSKDGHNDNLGADEQSEGEDATVQISKTELAAIRRSASNPAVTPDLLREINQRRLRETSTDDEQDSTRTFDRGKLDSLLSAGPPTTEINDDDIDTGVVDGDVIDAAIDDAWTNHNDAEASGEPEDLVDAPEEDIELGLDELSDDDMRAVVYAEQATPADSDLGVLSDEDLHAVVFGEGDAQDPFEVVDDVGIEVPLPVVGDDTGNLEELADLAQRTVGGNTAPAEIEIAPPEIMTPPFERAQIPPPRDDPTRRRA